MWVIVKDNIVVCTCDNEPDSKDLETRNETKVQTDLAITVGETYKDGVFGNV